MMFSLTLSSVPSDERQLTYGLREGSSGLGREALAMRSEVTFVWTSFWGNACGGAHCIGPRR
jgi:hypothetical protein